MNFMKCVAALGLTLALVACGGGGGSAGTPVTGTATGTGTDTGTDTGTVTVPVGTPTMALTVVDAVGIEITNHILSQTQAQFLKIVLKDGAGAAEPYNRVTVALDSSAAVLVPVSGTQLTDASGVVLMRIAPASVNSSGTVRATAVSTVDATALSQTYDFQITAGTVSLSAVTVSPVSVQNGQSVNVYVDVVVNGVPATSNSVAVNFNSSCGTVTPTSSLVDSTGRASAVVQTTSTGSCSVDASVNGVNSLPTAFTVTEPPISGIQFVSATPSLIYQTGSAGVNTSIVTFKVIDSLAAGVQGVTVNASLTNTDGGINFCGSPSTGSSAADGTVSFSICAGTLPATAQVRAELADTPAVFTNSNLLTVQTGLPTQRFFDISASKLNFYAGGYFTSKFNGNTVTISVFAADRQGNPVPDGTKIIFVAEGGQINSSGQSSCLLTSGRCSVDLIGQDYRPMGSSAPGGDPRPGRVTLLAYADGEESFIDKPDANGYYNNRYDLDKDELFENLGSPYLDKDESGLFLSAYTNLVTGTNEGESTYPMPSGSIGNSACPANSNVGLSAANTCNNVWDGYTKVRRQIVIVFSGGNIGQPGDYDAVTNPDGYHATIPLENRTQVVGTPTNKKVIVRLADRDGNPLPADASLSVQVLPSTSTCKATLLNSQVGSTIEPSIHTVTLESCGASDTVRFKSTVSSGGDTLESFYDVPVPAAPVL